MLKQEEDKFLTTITIRGAQNQVPAVGFVSMISNNRVDTIGQLDDPRHFGCANSNEESAIVLINETPTADSLPLKMAALITVRVVTSKQNLVSHDQDYLVQAPSALQCWTESRTRRLTGAFKVWGNGSVFVLRLGSVWKRRCES